MSELEALHKQIRACTGCKLHSARTNAVPGEGSGEARIMFIGEGQTDDPDGLIGVKAEVRWVTDTFFGVILLEGVDDWVNAINVKFQTNDGDTQPPEDSD